MLCCLVIRYVGMFTVVTRWNNTFIVIIKNFGTTIFYEVQMKWAHKYVKLYTYIDKITSTDLHISLEYRHVPRLEICKLELKLNTYELTSLV